MIGAVLLPVFVLASAGAWTAGGHVEGDARAAFPRGGGEPYWERLQSVLALRLEGEPHGRLRVVADGRVLHRTEQEFEVAAFGERQPHAPWRLDGDALFVEVRGLGGPAGWARLGRQSVRWGRGLVVSPTSLVSPPDLEDPLRFGAPRGAEMLRLYVPAGPLRIEAIAVHAFRPALLPPVGVRDALASSGVPGAEAIARDPSWTIDLAVRDPLPGPSFAEAPLAARVSAALPFLGMEVAASAYDGRWPIPELAEADVEVDAAARMLSGDARLAYPRLRMFGADAIAEVPVPLLDAIAVYAEGAWVMPEPFERVTRVFGAERRETLFEEPYARGVAGVERAGVTYVAVEYVRGFFDELGAERQGDYLFAVAERRFLRETLTLRVVAGYGLGDGSRVIAPDLGWSPADGVTLSLGAYAGFGAEGTTFAGPLAGDRVVLARVRYSF